MTGFANPNRNSESLQRDTWMDSRRPQLQLHQGFSPHPPVQDQLYLAQRSPLEDDQHRPIEFYEQNVKLQLLKHSSVLTEMQLVAQKRIRMQQRPSSSSSLGQVGATAPCLFVILPKVTPKTMQTMDQPHDSQGHQQYPMYHTPYQQQQEVSQEEFCLHFLCDYSEHEHTSTQDQHGQEGAQEQRQHTVDESTDDVPVDTGMSEHFAESSSAFPPSTTTAPAKITSPFPTPRLHICNPDHGYALRSTEDFCQAHKMCLLSLLCALQSTLFQEQDREHDQDQQQEEGPQETLVEGPGYESHGNAKNGGDVELDESSIASPIFSIPQFPRSTSSLSSLPFLSSHSTPQLMQRRVDIAIRYLLGYFSMSDLESILQSPSNADKQDYGDTFMPDLQVEDFAASDMGRVTKTMTADGRILGSLIQYNTRTTASSLTKHDTTATASTTTATKSASSSSTGIVHWLCPHHKQLCCKAQAREKLKAVIHKNEGSCVEQEQSAEIFFRTRERAVEFYELLREYRCVINLKIHLGWHDLNEDDLWELGEVVNEANIGSLTLDCCCEAKDHGACTERLETEEHRHPQRTQMSFKPLFGMLFSPSLVSFTLENFSGSLPQLLPSNFSASLDTFSLQAFRQSTELVLPSTNNLRTLILNHCGPDTTAQNLAELIRHSPRLTEIQMDVDKIENSLTTIGEATNQLDKITFLKLSESPWDCVELSCGKAQASASDLQTNRPQQTIIQGITRRTRHPPTHALQTCGVLEKLTTCCFLELWEKHQTALATLIAWNPRLTSLELMCETGSMDRLWRFVMSHYHHAQQVQLQEHQLSQLDIREAPIPPTPTATLTADDVSSILSLTAATPITTSSSLRLRLNDKTCSLITLAPTMNVLVLQGYTEKHRLLLQSLQDITYALCIGTSFDSAEQLALLLSHLENDGPSGFTSLTWSYSPQQQDDPNFLEQLRALFTRSHFTRLAIRVYAPLFTIRGLIRVWNWVVEAAWLSEGEHGRWIQSCLEHERGEKANASFVKDDAVSYHGMREIKIAKKILEKSASNNSFGLLDAAAAEAAVAMRRQLPGYGLMQNYTLPLDEERELTLSSSHFIFSSMATPVVPGTNTALAYSLRLSAKSWP
ncbi:hypothetical protein BC939DRAFT_464817 [Gamsiella multidivaricata]|uniref:uncharacterized protein n=1 Tax=Gamsiella multidivaricata TaxID=101098 RepID=UPI00221FB53B|nr:uncharacterized protein BC939DRAFT_464817 [Gamsiella multidivaricata]KAG0355082.1 hypothetical protein BGZ54_001316 [Gamsiella multidivaricata]KAI7817821.1 hypothetical protein BC939DRAFT_464817 [Gamsiella multidivaricata]